MILPDSLSIEKEPYRPRTPDEEEVHELYSRLIQAWNCQDAHGFAALFSKHAITIGFDGTQLTGQKEIESTLINLFRNHAAAIYIAKVRDIKSVSNDVVQLRSVVSMMAPGEHDINPELNAVQSLIAVKSVGGWTINLLQDTPARFGGGPVAREDLTRELRELI